MASGAGDVEGGIQMGSYNTGFSRIKLIVHPWLPSSSNASYMVLFNSSLVKRADLIPLGAEPLARIATSIERMVTYEGTLEVRLAKAHMLLTNLPA
jgi:hypothetical protein